MTVSVTTALTVVDSFGESHNALFTFSCNGTESLMRRLAVRWVQTAQTVHRSAGSPPPQAASPLLKSRWRSLPALVCKASQTPAAHKTIKPVLMLAQKCGSVPMPDAPARIWQPSRVLHPPARPLRVAVLQQRFSPPHRRKSQSMDWAATTQPTLNTCCNKCQ